MMGGPWRGWVVMAALAGAAGWMFGPASDATPTLVQPRRDRWQLPPLPPREDQTLLAAEVATAPMWGAAPAAAGAVAAAAAADTRWRLAAVYGVQGDRSALITFAAPDRPPKRVQAGDLLPSGHRIVSIGTHDVCVQLGRKTYRLGVERSD